MKRVFEYDFQGRKLVIEHGELAKQARGAVLVRYDDTVILSTAVMSNNVSTADFFPLTILYQEKLYSVGKIPGGFIKREGRPTDAATLTARVIDRPIRPMFDENFRNEVQVVNTVLSVDPDRTPEMTALFGTSLALGISSIPFEGPVAGVVVGKIDGELKINPTCEEMERSTINLTVAGTKEAINMVESGSKEVSEDEMLEALMFGHEAVRELCAIQDDIISEIGEEKIEVVLASIPEELIEEVNNDIKDDMVAAIQIKDKLEKYARIDEVKEEALVKYSERHEGEEDLEANLKLVSKIANDIEGNEVRRLITNEKIRPDGRAMDEIRELSADVDLLPRTHGSALFTRGQTQALAITTLGAQNEEQILDGLSLEDSKKFIFHYNFPSFSVGETGRYGSPGRREIGHGALAERALLQVMPSQEEFPYTVRVVSEVLESNGSSSQASICAGCMSLMAAGVPIKAPVAGIAMGLITEDGTCDSKYTILTDIQGLEDHMGDMDFKVAGTRKGITALQMDIKIKGVTKDVLKEALSEANKARMKILDVMESTIPAVRSELSEYAPKTRMMKIATDKIKDVIGKGGDTITKIILESSNVTSVSHKDAVKIDIDDDGNVICYHMKKEVLDKAISMIEDIVKDVEIGQVYTVKVVKIEDFGAFVELWPGCEGLVHVSQLDNKRVNHPSDMLKVGDEIVVKATGFDKRGKLNLSRKELLPKPEKKEKVEEKVEE
ncbi:MAG: polyribonucleotide nucleotidyltransferase [Bacilli bacterium]|jgi:polyribonucleotide nucleotidyltransferase|nr:polyribonucleotide nucleotidyltransferase [Bacilli bacterium]